MSKEEKPIYTFIEVKSYDDGGVIKRLNVSGKTGRSVDTIQSGMERNMNQEKFYTVSYDSEFELNEI